MIEAKIIKDSYNPDSKSRLTTFELTYPRFIHGELMTHRMFSRNAASSRAIPIDKVIELLQTNPAMPVHWGKNQTGMQANTEIDNIEGAKQLWLAARDSAISHAIVMRDMGLHKQIVNRVLEPFQLIKTIVTATEYKNWFWLRDHADAQPEIRELAKKMHNAYIASNPVSLFEGEWHVPYVNTVIRWDGTTVYFDENDNEITAEEAKMISASCCAQVSYRKNDGSLEKAQVVFDRLINSVPVHASPVEHIATPITKKQIIENSEFDIGVTHLDVKGNWWSGNLRGWVQYRQLIPNNVKKG